MIIATVSIIIIIMIMIMIKATIENYDNNGYTIFNSNNDNNNDSNITMLIKPYLENLWNN